MEGLERLSLNALSEFKRVYEFSSLNNVWEA